MEFKHSGKRAGCLNEDSAEMRVDTDWQTA